MNEVKVNKVRRDAPLGYSVQGIVELAGGAANVSRLLTENGMQITLQGVTRWASRIPREYAQAVAIFAGLPLEIVRPDMVRAGHAEALEYVRRRQSETGAGDAQKE